MILEAVDAALKEYGRIDYLINGKEYFYDFFNCFFHLQVEVMSRSLKKERKGP